MKSAFRFNGSEVIVENVIPASPEFNDAIVAEVQKVIGKDKHFIFQPVKNFAVPDMSEAIFNDLLIGKYEGEAPIVIIVTDEKGSEIKMTFPAFLSFRK